jgi:glycosyltransferase involved in cell wall biosynthesis
VPRAPVSISVVIPVRNSAAHLTRALAALAASTVRPLEVVVVDDGSTDGSSDVARSGGALVVCVPDGPRGPAGARNLGARHAKGDVLFFLDADVLAHRDTIANIERCLREHPDVAAVFGSYDDTPDHRSAVSRYRNLLHHYVHQQGHQEASTFWAGCGAVRRRVFEAAGGFDEGYARPSIEDIELGVRLRAAGHRILLRPDIQVTHLKHWTVAGIVHSDIRDRAIPWTRLILGQARIPADLNTSRASRVAAVAAWLAVAGLVLRTGMPGAGWGALGALAALVGLNAGLYGFFVRKGGPIFAVVAVGMHILYLLYSSAVFAALFIAGWGRRLVGRRAA